MATATNNYLENHHKRVLTISTQPIFTELSTRLPMHKRMDAAGLMAREALSAWPYAWSPLKKPYGEEAMWLLTSDACPVFSYHGYSHQKRRAFCLCHLSFFSSHWPLVWGLCCCCPLRGLQGFPLILILGIKVTGGHSSTSFDRFDWFMDSLRPANKSLFEAKWLIIFFGKSPDVRQGKLIESCHTC